MRSNVLPTHVAYKVVAERISNYHYSALIIFTVDFTISTNEDDLSHSARMTFPGNIKGGENALFFSSSHIFRAGQTDPLFLSNPSSRPPSP